MSTILYLFYEYFIIFPKNTAEGFIPFQSYYLVDEYLVYLQGQDRCASMHTKLQWFLNLRYWSMGGET